MPATLMAKRKRKAGENSRPPRTLDNLVPIQRRMLAVLSDGLPHTKGELFACLWDDLSKMTAVQYHVSIIRHALLPYGHTVVCELSNRCAVRYRWVRLLTP